MRKSLLIGGACFLLGALGLALADTAPLRPEVFIARAWTWSGIQSFNSGKLVLNGSGSGSSILNAPATGGGTVTLPAGAGTLVFSTGVSATTITSGSTLVAGGATGRLLYDNAGTLGEPTMTASSGDLTLGSTTGPVGGSVLMWGSTSGSLQVKPPAAAGTGSVLTLPGGTTDFSATGGTSQFVKQASVGAALTVARPACADLSDAGAGCSGAAGSGTVNSGTAGQMAYYATTTTAVSGNANATISSGDLTLGVTSGPVAGSVKVWGSTSGSLQIKPAAAAGTGSVLTLPGGTTDFSATGGANQVVKQSTTGAALTVAALVAADIPATTLASGTSVSLSAPREYYVCTSTCTVTPPVPAAGYEFCVLNGDNVATAITMAALGSSAMYENTARTAYGTAGTGTLVSTAAAANKVCILGLDATHYLTTTYTGSWTAS